MSSDEKNKRRAELIQKKISQGLTLTEAYELSMLGDMSLIENCVRHNQKYLSSAKCPNCLE